MSTPSRSRLAEWRAAIARVRHAYTQAHGRAPNLLRPRRFTEKLQWRKLFDPNPVFTTLCDKLAARTYIEARIGPEHIIPLLWSGLPPDIPWATLTPPFFLKSTHASGQVIQITRDNAPDRAAITAQAETWLTLNYGTTYDEPGYTRVPPRLMVEQTLITQDGGRPPERRLFVFGGKVAIINTVFAEQGRIRNGAFHTPDWSRLDWHFTRTIPQDFSKPARLADMIRMAERLGRGLDHIRIDIYDCGDKFWIGELTPYAWSGLARFTPDEADFALGKYWRLPFPAWRAAFAIATRSKQAVLF